MACTEILLKLSLDTNLKDCVDGYDGKKLSKGDLIKEISREAYNCTRGAVFVDSQLELINAIKMALSCRVKAGSYETISDLLDHSKFAFCSKVKSNLAKAAASMGNYIPKFSNSNISDAGVFFPKVPLIESGFTSYLCGQAISGSGNGAYITAYGFLSSKYRVDGKVKSIFDLIHDRNKSVLKLLDDLAGEKISDEICLSVDACLKRKPTTVVDQFYKQNFVEYDGEMISCTPLLSVGMAIEVKNSIDSIFKNEQGNLQYSRFRVGGTNSQNVSILNSDLGGSPWHFKAWIPRPKNGDSVFKKFGRLRNFTSNKEVNAECSQLKIYLARINAKGTSNASMRDAINQAFVRCAELYITSLKDALTGLQCATEKDRSAAICGIDDVVLRYLRAETKREVSSAGFDMGLLLAGKIKTHLNLNMMPFHIDECAISAMCGVFERNGDLCL